MENALTTSRPSSWSGTTIIRCRSCKCGEAFQFIGRNRDTSTNHHQESIKVRNLKKCQLHLSLTSILYILIILAILIIYSFIYIFGMFTLRIDDNILDQTKGRHRSRLKNILLRNSKNMDRSVSSISSSRPAKKRRYGTLTTIT